MLVNQDQHCLISMKLMAKLQERCAAAVNINAAAELRAIEVAHVLTDKAGPGSGVLIKVGPGHGATLACRW